MTKLYQTGNGESRKSSAPRQPAASPDQPPRFSSFAGRRSFPPIPISRQICQVRRAYFALPMALFDIPVANEALALVAQHAKEVFDPRNAFADNDDWRKRCGNILRGCNSIYVLTTPDKELSAGCYAEVAYAYALGLPVHVISWQLRGKLKLEFGGEIVGVWGSTLWRAAQYRPPGRAERTTYILSSVITRAKTRTAAACEFLRARFTKPKEKAAG